MNEKSMALESGTSFLGTPIRSLAFAATRRGYEVKGHWSSQIRSATSDELPALVTVDLPELGLPHVVAVTRYEADSFLIQDPTLGSRWMSREDLSTAAWGAWISIRPPFPR